MGFLLDTRERVKRVHEGSSTEGRGQRGAPSVPPVRSLAGSAYAALPAYAELHCLSNFTFLRGASRPEELVQHAHALGYKAIAITDECSVAGVVRAHVAARECRQADRKKEEEKHKGKDQPKKIEDEFKLIIGTEVKLADGPKLVLLATDRASYGRMCALITRGRMRTSKGEYRLEWTDFDEGLEGCLALLVPDARCDPEHAQRVAERFSNRAWIAVELVYGQNDAARLAALRTLARQSGLPLVASGDVHMHLRSRRPLQDVMTAIRLGLTVETAGEALHPNAERRLRPRAHLGMIYPPELIAETVCIANRCSFDLDTLRYEYPVSAMSSSG